MKQLISLINKTQFILYTFYLGYVQSSRRKQGKLVGKICTFNVQKKGGNEVIAVIHIITF